MSQRRLFNLSSAYRSRAWFSAACVLTAIALSGLIPSGEYRTWIAPVLLGASAGVALGVLRSSRRRAELAVEEERTWLDALPFAVERLWELYDEDWSRPGDYLKLRFTIDFESDAPDAKDLHERLLDARLLELRTLDAQPDRVEVVLAIGAQRVPADVVTVVHRLLEDALVPLHESRPIRRVRATLETAPAAL